MYNIFSAIIINNKNIHGFNFLYIINTSVSFDKM